MEQRSEIGGRLNCHHGGRAKQKGSAFFRLALTFLGLMAFALVRTLMQVPLLGHCPAGPIATCKEDTWTLLFGAFASSRGVEIVEDKAWDQRLRHTSPAPATLGAISNVHLQFPISNSPSPIPFPSPSLPP